MTSASGFATARPTRARRDRHDRGLRGSLAPAAVPISRSRAAQFDELVVGSVERIQRGYPELSEVEILIEEVPPREVRDGSADPIPLGRVVPAVGSQPAQLVVHRRPIELRGSGDAREELVHDTVTELVASLFGIAPALIDPDYGKGQL